MFRGAGFCSHPRDPRPSLPTHLPLQGARPALLRGDSLRLPPGPGLSQVRGRHREGPHAAAGGRAAPAPPWLPAPRPWLLVDVHRVSVLQRQWGQPPLGLLLLRPRLLPAVRRPGDPRRLQPARGAHAAGCPSPPRGPGGHPHRPGLPDPQRGWLDKLTGGRGAATPDAAGIGTVHAGATQCRAPGPRAGADGRGPCGSCGSWRSR